jgi:hypothetical protein
MRPLRNITAISIALALATTACKDPNVDVQPPGAPTVSISPSEPTTLDPIVVEIAEPTDGAVTGYTFAWTRDGQAVPDATTDTIAPEATAKGQTWAVTVTPFSGQIAGSPATAEVRVINVNPITIGLHWNASPADTNTRLVAVAETEDADGDPVTVRYTWTRDGEATAITGPEVGPERTARDQVWEVTAIPNDGEADGDPRTLSIVIDNAPPTIAEVLLEPPMAYVATTLTASASGLDDPDGDAVTVRWAWFVNGSAIASATGPTLAGPFRKGDFVEVEATPDDGTELGEPLRSRQISILNTPPPAPAVGITPDAPTAGVDSLQCVVRTPSVDADGDAVAYRMSWTIDGVAVTRTTTRVHPGDTVDAASVTAGRAVCTAIPNDGTIDGPAATASVTVSAAFTRATCTDMVTEDDTWGLRAKGLDLRAYTNDTLVYIGCPGDGCSPSEFYCREDSRAQTLEFGANGSTLRAAVDPKREHVGKWPSSYSGCCREPMGLCNSFDSNNNGVRVSPADALCWALGFEKGEIVRESTGNSCPEINVNDDDGQEWTSDWVSSDGYGSDYRCTGYR